MPDFGSRLPSVDVAPPGPVSRALARRLARVESRNITHITDDWPVFWRRAAGANVEDVDGNVYIDLTAGFGVAAAGHAHPAVVDAIARQAALLPHGLGDVHPAAAKVELLERLALLLPSELEVTILGGAGAEAVEAALKTAMLYSGRSGVLAFSGGYHGLTLGALAVTDRPESRDPFLPAIFGGVRFAPYPDGEAELEPALREARRLVEQAGTGRDGIAAVIVEPIQGRGGIVVPPPGFLPGLRRLCDESGALLVIDEIYSGLGRTGRWLACEHTGVVPDIVTIGKALSGSLQISAAVGRRTVMEAWPASAGEAIHTSTFLGNPTACAAALAHLEVIERDGLPERAARLGEALGRRLASWTGEELGVAQARGLGLMQGVLLRDRAGRTATERAGDAVRSALRAGVLLLSEGPRGGVLAFTPPLVIGEDQLEHALDVVERALRA